MELIFSLAAYTVITLHEVNVSQYNSQLKVSNTLSNKTVYIVCQLTECLCRDLLCVIELGFNHASCI